MSDRPFVHIYVSRFLADTSWLSAEEVGAYSLLLAAIWNGDGELPAEEERLARIARLSVEQWRHVWPVIEPYFYVNDAGRWTTVHVKKWFSKATVFGRPKLSAELRNTIFDRDGSRCRYCGATDGPFHIDHVIAVARGGSDDPENLVVACMACNLSKGKKPLEEWRQ